MDGLTQTSDATTVSRPHFWVFRFFFFPSVRTFWQKPVAPQIMDCQCYPGGTVYSLSYFTNKANGH